MKIIHFLKSCGWLNILGFSLCVYVLSILYRRSTEIKFFSNELSLITCLFLIVFGVLVVSWATSWIVQKKHGRLSAYVKSFCLVVLVSNVFYVEEFRRDLYSAAMDVFIFLMLFISLGIEAKFRGGIYLVTPKRDFEDDDQVKLT